MWSKLSERHPTVAFIASTSKVRAVLNACSGVMAANPLSRHVLVECQDSHYVKGMG